MTNGTRIDPEEREPRAIKIRNKKRKGKKIIPKASNSGFRNLTYLTKYKISYASAYF